jgi:hypothetical protein
VISQVLKNDQHPRMCSEGVGERGGRGAGDLIKFFRMTSRQCSEGVEEKGGRGVGDLFKFFRMTSIPASF